MSEKSNNAVGVTVHTIIMALLGGVIMTFYALSLAQLRGQMGTVWFSVALAGGALLVLAIFVAALIFRLRGMETPDKLCITSYVTVAFFVVVAYVLLKTGFFSIVRDEAALQTYLERAGSWVSVAFTLLQFLQVVVLPIPSTVTVVAGAAIFGAFTGSLLSLAGIMLGSLVAFLIGRYAGMRVVAWLVGRETLDKWLEKIKGKDKLLLTAMFVLPVFPDDVLCFVAGISSMSVWYFLSVIFLSRVLAIFATSYSVAFIPFNTWWGILIWAVLIAAVIALFVVLFKKSEAILGWFERKFRRETRVTQKEEKGEFTIEVIDPDGSIVSKGVKKKPAPPPQKPR